jgi:hypothetical protein
VSSNSKISDPLLWRKFIINQIIHRFNSPEEETKHFPASSSASGFKPKRASRPSTIRDGAYKLLIGKSKRNKRKTGEPNFERLEHDEDDGHDQFFQLWQFSGGIVNPAYDPDMEWN